MFLFFSALYFYPSSVFSNTPVFALTNPTLDEPPLEILQFDTQKSLGSLIKVFIDWALKFAGVFAFAMIVFAGFEYTTSGGNTSKQKDAQEKIIGAIVGIILLFSFYIILNTINPDILKSPPETAAPTPLAVTPPGQEPSKNLVNIIEMGIPVNVPTLGKSEAYLDKTLADILLTLKDKTPAWLVTDACIDPKCQSTSEPDRNSDDCHLDGTCVDIDSVSGNYNDNIKLIKIFNDAGLAVLDEVSHLHVALMGANGYGSYPGSNYCITEGCWYGAI